MNEIVGVALAVLGAIGIAGQVMAVRVGTHEGSTTDALTVVLLVNVAIFVPLAAVLEFPAYRMSTNALLSFVAAGLLGTLLGRALYYTSIDRLGASITEPIKASNPLFAVVLAVLLLGDPVTNGQFAGVVLIVAGVAWLSKQTVDGDATLADAPARALTLPFATALVFALEPVIVKVGFGDGTSVMSGLAVKTVVAAAGMWAYLRWRNALPAPGDLVRSPNRRWYLLAGLSNSVFLLSYYAALSLAPVSLVVPILQLSPLIVMALSYAFLDKLERVTLGLVAGAVVVVLGAVVVTLA